MRASVAQDTVQTVQDSASEILLGAVPDTILTSKQVLAYIGHVSRLIDALSATTLKELNPKTLISALMRKWPAALCHLMEDKAQPNEDWEALLERLAEYCADTSNTTTIIRALVIPLPTQNPKKKPCSSIGSDFQGSQVG